MALRVLDAKSGGQLLPAALDLTDCIAAEAGHILPLCDQEVRHPPAHPKKQGGWGGGCIQVARKGGLHPSVARKGMQRPGHIPYLPQGHFTVFFTKGGGRRPSTAPAAPAAWGPAAPAAAVDRDGNSSVARAGCRCTAGEGKSEGSMMRSPPSISRA